LRTKLIVSALSMVISTSFGTLAAPNSNVDDGVIFLRGRLGYHEKKMCTVREYLAEPRPSFSWSHVPPNAGHGPLYPNTRNHLLLLEPTKKHGAYLAIGVVEFPGPDPKRGDLKSVSSGRNDGSNGDWTVAWETGQLTSNIPVPAGLKSPPNEIQITPVSFNNRPKDFTSQGAVISRWVSIGVPANARQTCGDFPSKCPCVSTRKLDPQ
jgi:hypothetical protein